MIHDCPLYYGSWWGRSEAYQLLECPLRISNNLLKDFGWKTSNLGSCGCGSKLGTLPSTNSITNMGIVKSLSKTCFRCEIWWFFHAHISTWKRHPGIPRKWMMQNLQFLAHKQELVGKPGHWSIFDETVLGLLSLTHISVGEVLPSYRFNRQW